MSSYITAELRRLVYERARGRCEYYLIPEDAVFVSHEVDHVIPQKHGGPTEADNLALSCAICNKHKGSDLASIDPQTDAIVPLFHPRRERWSEHFRLSGAHILPLTPTGRVTVRLLHFNSPNRLEERGLLISAAWGYRDFT